MSRELFEKLHQVPEGAGFSMLLNQYCVLPSKVDRFGEIGLVCEAFNLIWQGFQSGHAAGLEQQAKRIAELEAKLVAAQSLHDKTVTLYDYLLETDEEGLIHHATQMRDVCLAVHEYRNADQAFSKEPK